MLCAEGVPFVPLAEAVGGTPAMFIPVSSEE